MSNDTQVEKTTFSHYTIKERAIFKGITTNENGNFFAKISFPTGQKDEKQTYINVSAFISTAPAMQALASALAGSPINGGKGTAAKVELTNMKAVHAFDDTGALRCDDQGVPFINYTAFLNGIAFE